MFTLYIYLPYYYTISLVCYFTQVAWLRVDTQTILSIQTLVVTKNDRMEVTHTDHRVWRLHIKNVRQSDRGFYMCQINTDPMKNQIAYLDVVGKILRMRFAFKNIIAIPQTVASLWGGGEFPSVLF